VWTINVLGTDGWSRENKRQYILKLRERMRVQRLLMSLCFFLSAPRNSALTERKTGSDQGIGGARAVTKPCHNRLCGYDALKLQ
jgi:hypothetical protein